MCHFRVEGRVQGPVRVESRAQHVSQKSKFRNIGRTMNYYNDKICIALYIQTLY